MLTCLENKYKNQEAEEAILGTLIMNNIYLSRVFSILKSEYFYFGDLAKVYDKILELINNGSVANSITLKPFFENELENPKLLGHLLASASTIVDIKDYALQVVELWQKRKIEELKQDIDLNKPFEEIKNSIFSKIYDLEISTDSDPKTIQKATNELVDKIAKGEIDYMDTGFFNLDLLIGGIEKGNAIIVGGKSSSGKTTFTLCLAKELSKKYDVCFFSVEVSTPAITRKFITNLANINPYRLKRGTLNQTETIALNNRNLEEYKLLIDETKALTLGKIRAKLNKLLLKQKVDFIFIDYLQLMESEKKEFSREQEISKLAIGLKKIALDYNLVVVALSQLSRSNEGRDNKKPILSDLRDSGAIEQSADLVIFVHREAYYLERAKPDYKKEPEKYMEWQRMYELIKNDADIILAKHRDGTTGEVRMRFDGEFSRFMEV